MVTQCLPGFNKYNRKAVAFQFGIVVQLPFLFILRALLGYNWFFDPARMQIQPGLFPIFVTIYTVCMVNHVRQYLPEVEQAVEEALGVKKDVAKKVVRHARSPVSIRAGTTHDTTACLTFTQRFFGLQLMKAGLNHSL